MELFDITNIPTSPPQRWRSSLHVTLEEYALTKHSDPKNPQTLSEHREAHPRPVDL